MVEYPDYQIPVTQIKGPKGNGDKQAAKRDNNATNVVYPFTSKGYKNTARTFFNNSELSAEITCLHEHDFIRCSKLLQAMASG